MRRELWTADDFLEWLEPGVHADLIDGETAYEEHGVDEYWVLDPQTLDHRFYRREGDFLTAFGEDEEIIRSAQVSGFALRRDWLDPANLPDVAACMAEIDALR